MVLWHHLPTNPLATYACRNAIPSQKASFVVVADAVAIAIATSMREAIS